MLQVNLPYYPGAVATMDQTPFGYMECITENPYERPLKNKIIVKIDTLQEIQKYIGTECFTCRDLLYNMLAGKDSWDKILASFYRRYKTFTAYVNDIVTYTPNTDPINLRVISTLNDSINAYIKQLQENYVGQGRAKQLILTNGYMYFGYAEGSEIPNFKGATIIC